MASITIPWDAIVRRVDPGRDRDMAREPVYELSKKTFYGDNRKNGPFTARNPSNVRAPTISGSTKAGCVIECDPGEWIGAPSQTLTFQWYAAGVAMPGADEAKLLTLEADAGTALICRVTCAANGQTAYADTDPIIITAS
jgi:hypothetical protein